MGSLHVKLARAPLHLDAKGATGLEHILRHRLGLRIHKLLEKCPVRRDAEESLAQHDGAQEMGKSVAQEVVKLYAEVQKEVTKKRMDWEGQPPIQEGHEDYPLVGGTGAMSLVYGTCQPVHGRWLSRIYPVWTGSNTTEGSQSARSHSSATAAAGAAAAATPASVALVVVDNELTAFAFSSLRVIDIGEDEDEETAYGGLHQWHCGEDGTRTCKPSPQAPTIYSEEDCEPSQEAQARCVKKGSQNVNQVCGNPDGQHLKTH